LFAILETIKYLENASKHLSRAPKRVGFVRGGRDRFESGGTGTNFFNI